MLEGNINSQLFVSRLPLSQGKSACDVTDYDQCYWIKTAEYCLRLRRKVHCTVTQLFLK